MALEEMERANGDGLRFAVDCDLKSFFDTVNHGLLMNRLQRKVNDKRVLRLISRYLNAGVILSDGDREPTPCGVPQWLNYYGHSRSYRNCLHLTNGYAAVCGSATGNSGSDREPEGGI